MHGICRIFGAGEPGGPSFVPQEADILIAADGGYLRLRELGLMADVILGDFDSAPNPGQGIALNPIKDETDMQAAVNYARTLGCRRFHIYGGLGGRLSHTLANIQMLAALSQVGCEVTLFGRNCTVTAITDGQMTFPAAQEGYLSVFAHSECCTGVYESGLKYRLDDATLRNGFALGVSNEFIGENSCVGVKSGTLILMIEEKEKGTEES